VISKKKRKEKPRNTRNTRKLKDKKEQERKINRPEGILGVFDRGPGSSPASCFVEHTARREQAPRAQPPARRAYGSEREKVRVKK